MYFIVPTEIPYLPKYFLNLNPTLPMKGTVDVTDITNITLVP